MHAFLKSESGAITVDWTVLTASLAGMGLAVGSVVSGGLQDLSNDIRDYLTGVEMSDEFRDLVSQVCMGAGLGTGPGPGGDTGETYNGKPVIAMLIYQSSDFIGGLPAEANWQAAGPSPHTMTVAPDAQPQVIYIADDDEYLHENDDSQQLAQTITLNGEVYEEGFEVSSGYTLTDSTTGLMASGLHFANTWNGQMQGPVFATAASHPLEPGQSYTFDQNITTHNNEQPYYDYLGCA